MMHDERMVLKRMVVLVFLATVLFIGYALKRQYLDESVMEKRHLDKSRVQHLATLLSSIKKVPERQQLPLPANDFLSLCPNGQQLVDDINELNRRLEHLRTGDSPFLFNRYQLDSEGWFAAVSQEQNGCAVASAALGELLWRNRKKKIESTVLERLEWMEKQKLIVDNSASVVSLDPRIYATHNPWRSLPGRVLLPDRRTENRSAYYLVKGANMGTSITGMELPGLTEEKHRVGLRETSRQVPRGIHVFVEALEPWRNPEAKLYQDIIQDQNREKLPGGLSKEVGLHTLFTIDPEMQSRAQVIAECYTGEQKACVEAGLSPPGEPLYEKARARRVGIAVIDIASGEIEALASSESPCFRHDLTGTGKRPNGCMELEDEATMALRGNTDALLNHAVLMEAPPASTAKPILVVGMLADKSYTQNVKKEDLEVALKKSNTPLFLDWMFCAEKGIPNACGRPRGALMAAHDLGWNLGCAEKDSNGACGFIDILFGRPIVSKPVGFEKDFPVGRYAPVSKAILLGRLLIDSSDGELRDMTDEELFPAPYLGNLKKCAKAAWEMDELTQKAGLEVVSEGMGQGNSRATPLGVATMMGSLAASAQGMRMPYPHLVRDLLGTDGVPVPYGHPLKRWGLPETVSGIDKDRAGIVVNAMRLAHRPGGTANRGCVKIMGGKCDEDLGIASKTGTPGFDKVHLSQYNAAWKIYAQHRKQYVAYTMQQQRLQRGETISEQERKLRPVLPPSRPPVPWKWYAGFFNSTGSSQDNAGRYDKAFAVLVERNWHVTTKAIDDPKDSDSSAAEIGMALVRAIRQQTERKTP